MVLAHAATRALAVVSVLALLFISTAGSVFAIESLPEPAEAFPPVPISARAAVVLDDTSGQFVYGKNPHQRLAPASITKIVTAIVALQHDDPNRVVTVHVDWWDLTDSTVMGLFRGERLSIEDLLYGLMLPSGNDAALALARAVASSETHFVELMNEQAWTLGLRNTHFMNPHGLDEPGHYTSAYDIAMLARYAMQHPLFARIAASKRATVQGRGVYPLRNINRFLQYYPGADGVKNGYTDNAGQTLVGSATRNGRRVFVAVMGSYNYVADAQALLDYYFDNLPSSALTGRRAQGGDSLTLAYPRREFRLSEWFDPAPSSTGLVPRHLRMQ